MLELIKYAVCFAVVGYVYAEILCADGMILEPWREFLKRHLIKEKKVPVQSVVPDVVKDKVLAVGEITVVKESWLYKPLVGCFICVTGQLALWGYLIIYFHRYNLFEHIIVICGAILITKFISLTVQKMEL